MPRMFAGVPNIHNNLESISFIKDNAAARLRVRKATLELEKLGKQYRKESVK